MTLTLLSMFALNQINKLKILASVSAFLVLTSIVPLGAFAETDDLSDISSEVVEEVSPSDLQNLYKKQDLFMRLTYLSVNNDIPKEFPEYQFGGVYNKSDDPTDNVLLKKLSFFLFFIQNVIAVLAFRDII